MEAPGTLSGSRWRPATRPRDVSGNGDRNMNPLGLSTFDPVGVLKVLPSTTCSGPSSPRSLTGPEGNDRAEGEAVHRRTGTTILCAGVGISVLVTAVVMVDSVASASSITSVRPSSASVLRTHKAGPLLAGALELEGYNVTSASFSAPNGTQSSGSVSCPAGTVAYGGGVLLASTNLSADVNSSWPASDTEWSAKVNNTTGSAQPSPCTRPAPTRRRITCS